MHSFPACALIVQLQVVSQGLVLGVSVLASRVVVAQGGVSLTLPYDQRVRAYKYTLIKFNTAGARYGTDERVVFEIPHRRD